MIRRATSFALMVAVAALVIPATAGAKNFRSAYHIKGSWGTAVKHSGLCLETLTCPRVTNYQHGFFLQTKVGSLTGVGAASSGTFTSRSFKYRGAQGRRSNDLVLSLGRYANTGSLLSVAGNSARYTVAIVGARSGAAVAQPIRNGALTETRSWTRVARRVVPSSSLQLGRRYRVEISSTFKNGADVIPGASADYRKVKLVARKHVRKHQRRHHHRRHH